MGTPADTEATADLTPAEANRLHYRDHAETYDEFEDCVVNPRQRARLREALAGALAEAPAEPRVLDACGGTGNASELLFELGADPLTVDVSPEMLALWREKAKRKGIEARTVESEIDAFLRDGDEKWDVIVFSSALHHLVDYVEVVRLAAGRIAPGGVLLTIYDPTKAGRLAQVLRRLEYVIFLFLRRPREAFEKAGRKLRRENPPGRNLGDLAEFHAGSGVDDEAIEAELGRCGMEVVRHEREYEARFRVFRAIYRALGIPSAFSLLARRPAA